MARVDLDFTLHLGMFNSPVNSMRFKTNPRSLIQAGCSKVFITSRKAAACEEACAALNALPFPGKAISVPSDISQASEVDRLVAEVSKHTDHVDILFANAGASWGASFDKTPESSFDKVMNLNVKSVFLCTQKYYNPYTVRSNTSAC